MILANDAEEIRGWPKTQKTYGIELFLKTFNFETSKAKQTLVEQELARRASRKATQRDWPNRLAAAAVTALISAAYWLINATYDYVSRFLQ